MGLCHIWTRWFVTSIIIIAITKAKLFFSCRMDTQSQNCYISFILLSILKKMGPVNLQEKSEKIISNFSCMFLNPNSFFPISIPIVLIYYVDMRNLREQIKKHSVINNCSELSLFEWTVLVISYILQILSLQPRISKDFSRSLEQFFLTVGQNKRILFIPKELIFVTRCPAIMFIILTFQKFFLDH